jgi:hypothetical protein
VLQRIHLDTKGSAHQNEIKKCYSPQISRLLENFLARACVKSTLNDRDHDKRDDDIKNKTRNDLHNEYGDSWGGTC